MSRRAGVPVVLLLMLAAACAARSPRAYIRIAEALSSSHFNEGIYVAPQRLDPDVLRQACPEARRIVRLGTTTTDLRMQLGQRFPLSALNVVAVDDADVTVPGVPIVIEAQDFFPPVLQVASTDPEVIAGQLAPLNPGDFTLRISTLCGVPGAETTISGRVTAPIPKTPEPRFPGQLTNAGP